jgi:hypothetical protein
VSKVASSGRRALGRGARLANMTVAGLLVAVVFGATCATFGRQRLDYSQLASADRVVVRTTGSGSGPATTISDPEKVQFAVKFIPDRQDRWGDRLNPYVPALVLHFSAKGRDLGGYGIGRDILVALPDHGFWWRDVAAADIEVLLKTLALQMPEPVEKQ